MNSVPAAVASAVTGTVTAIHPLDALMASVNTNPYFIGIMMLLLNLGGRFLSLEISKDQERFLSQPIVRRFFLFAVLFVATRNILIAAGLSILVILFLGYLLNENSGLCLWKSCLVEPKGAEDSKKTEGFLGLSPEEAMILKRLQDKQMAAAQQQQQQTPLAQSPPETPVNASDIYQAALGRLRSPNSV